MHNIHIHRRETFKLPVRYETDAGTNIDLTNATFEFELKHNPGSDTNILTSTPSYDGTTLTVTLSHTTTANLDINRGYYFIWITYPNSEREALLHGYAGVKW